MCPADENSPRDKASELLALDSLQRDALRPHIEAILGATNDPRARDEYHRLSQSVAKLSVEPDLQGRLGAILELLLQSGRIRKQHGPGAESLLLALYQKTPQGRRISESIRALNVALEKLNGQSLEGATAGLRSPGTYALTLKTDQLQVVIRFAPEGVSIESMEVNLG